jgi:xanthine dehydrogenase accessory factor
MESIYTKLSEFVAAGETVAVATIVDIRGSVPREVGAKMIIHPLGRHVGTVGGGCGEGDVIRTALDVIQTGTPEVVHVDLTEDISMQSLGVCGGIMDVFVERVSGADIDTMDTLRAATTAREPVALVTVVRGLPDTGQAPGRQAAVRLDAPPLGSLGLGELEPLVIADSRETLQGRQHKLLQYQQTETGWQRAPDRPLNTSRGPASDIAVFVEVQRRAPELIIVGGGHIAVPLAQLGSLCDFAVTVLDDRPAFVTRERFPTAAQLLAAPLRETVRDLPMDADTFIVLVTRGHSHDVECLLEVLDRPVAYIGMIGSQRRVDAVFQLLAEEQGIDPAKFDRVHAPIGIAIGAHTPAEIAVCIMAEIINVFRGGPATSISDRRRAQKRQDAT